MLKRIGLYMVVLVVAGCFLLLGRDLSAQQLPGTIEQESYLQKIGNVKRDFLCISGSTGSQPRETLVLSYRPFVLDYPLYSPPNEQAPFILELHDAKNAVVASYKFGTDDMHVSRDDGDFYADSGMFAFSVPFTSTMNRMIIKNGDTVCYDSVRSPNPPEITILNPVENAVVTGTIVIEWHGEDPDGDQLLYRLESSTDGGQNWTPETGFTTVEKIEKEVKYFYADGAMQLRVICSDGFNTAIAIVNILPR